MKDHLRYAIKKALIELKPGSGHDLDQAAFEIEWLLNQRSLFQQYSLPSPLAGAEQLREIPKK
jgi:hypothetical protein